MARTLAPGEQADLMSNLKAAASELSDTRMLGERMVFLVSRFPRLVQWQVESQVAEVAMRGETRAVLADVSRLAGTAGEIHRQAEQMRGMLDEFPVNVAAAFSDQPLGKEAVATAKEAVVRTEAAVKLLSSVETAVVGLDKAITSLAGQVDRINRAYDPVAVQKMADEGRAVAVKEARSLIFLITGCLVGLMGLHAL